MDDITKQRHWKFPELLKAVIVDDEGVSVMFDGGCK
jgi:hypothetical protein